MKLELFLMLFRHALTAAGAYAVAKGASTPDEIATFTDTAMQGVGALATAIGLGWSAWRKYKRTPVEPQFKEGSASSGANGTVVKNLLFILPIFLLLGCATTIDPNADKFVVTSEQAVKAATYTIDKFLEWEHNNVLIVKQKYPAVHVVAEDLRTMAPAQIRGAWGFIGDYRDVRDSNTSNKLFVALTSLDRLCLLAETNYQLAKGK